MEQPCYKCGQTVEEGTAFCPHCSAPQIRVLITEPAAQPLAFSAAATKSRDSVALPASQTVPVLALPMQWSQALKPCALAALVALTLVLLRLYPAVALLSAGFLAVVFYRQRRPGIPLRAFEGARLGALAGIIFSIIISLFLAVAVTIPDVRAKMQDEAIKGEQQVAAWFPPNPNTQASIDQIRTPRGFIVFLVEASVGFFVLSVLLAGLGGALGGAVFRRRDKT
jgi:hypothetical protein